jgi:hypothetical protein
VLDILQQLQRLLEAHCERQSPGDRQPNLDLAAHQFGREQSLPAKQGKQIAPLHQGHGATLDPAYGLVGIAGRYRVLDCIRPQLLGGVPTASAAMQFGNFVAEFSFQPLPEMSAEKRVVAVPLPCLIERHQQKLANLNPFEQIPARRHAGHRLAQGGAKAVQDGGSCRFRREGARDQDRVA